MAEGTPFIDWGNKTATPSVLPWAAESGSTLAGRQVSLQGKLSPHTCCHTARRTVVPGAGPQEPGVSEGVFP